MVYVIFVVASFLEWLWGLVEDSVICSETGGQDVLLEASMHPHFIGLEVEQNPVLCEQCLLWVVCEVICLFCGLIVVGGVIWFVQSQGLTQESLALKSREWADVEGDLRCPNPPDLGRKRNTGSVPELHLCGQMLLKFVFVVNLCIVLGVSGFGLHHLTRGWGTTLVPTDMGELSPGGAWLFVSVFVKIVVRYIY